MITTVTLKIHPNSVLCSGQNANILKDLPTTAHFSAAPLRGRLFICSFLLNPPHCRKKSFRKNMSVKRHRLLVYASHAHLCLYSVSVRIVSIPAFIATVARNLLKRFEQAQRKCYRPRPAVCSIQSTLRNFHAWYVHRTGRWDTIFQTARQP